MRCKILKDISFKEWDEGVFRKGYQTCAFSRHATSFQATIVDSL